MEYTKRDLELIQALRNNFEKLREEYPYCLYGAAKCLFNNKVFSYGDFFNVRRLVRINLPPVSEWEHPLKWYPWNLEDIEPRKQFLDDLITKIKNRL